MFTGIVTHIGRVADVAARGDTRLVIEAAFEAAPALGASIACAGCCLTVVETGPGRFAVDASAETLSLTTLGAWMPGTRVNLERALKVGDELGGHIVSGHVDGLARLVSVSPEGGSHRLVIEAPEALARFIAPKGSVALDGVSLTVNSVEGRRFGVNIIPHTWSATTLGGLQPGQAMNLEIDMLARYVARLTERI
jgi:riboflavin synthase